MQVGLNDLAYVPTIYLRPAEVNALEHLSDADKDRIIPIALLRPWATSKTLSKALDRFETAFPDRSYFLGLDPFYSKPADANACAAEFSALRSELFPHNGWWQLIEGRTNAIPSVPLTNNPEQLHNQVGRANDLGRGFLIRIELTSGYLPGPIAAELATVDHSEFVVCLDVGWGRDLLGSEQWLDGWITTLIDQVPEIKIVVSGSSFPRSFTSYDFGDEETAQERTLYGNLARRHNAARLIYGDWGSSRSPVEQNGGGILVPRIDVPRSRSWMIFRADGSFGSFRDVATEALRSRKWQYDPNVWGQYVINNTAISDGYVIDTATKAASARINMHLHEQINQGQPPVGGLVEEDFVD